MTEPVDDTEQLIKDINDLRTSGCELAVAAIYVIKEYDGLHRLALAVSKWMQTVGNEGGRSAVMEKKGE